MSSGSALPDRVSAWLRAHPVARVAGPGLVLIGFGLAVFFGLLDAVRERDDLSAADLPVLEWLVERRGPVATRVLETITFISGPIVLPILVAVACGAWAIIRREWWRPLLLVGAMIGSTLISLAVKGLVNRPRPPEETMHIPGSESTASFPSGHTIGAATLLLVAAYLTTSRRHSKGRVVGWAVGTFVGVVLVALSRLYLGYHFLTDVLAAMALAVAILGAVTIVDRTHLWRHPESGAPPGQPATSERGVPGPG
ncbi:phosphatase PAP2 family protein [Cellulomonas cellasea]|uniref:phosphatase PAP2 family protein n=1 Tax=Cellulomonas cellasea TaxID=43670 RepID=UPI0025A3EA0A|nr:phosphatase PAP2 family protein [Cellulomonas cellasea]MDM8083656.1 phosphatase PAP2 family protein [Cellulomonas cellasea]